MDFQLIVITGMSGAGKATAARVFEDLQFNVVDNLPPHILPQLVEEFRIGPIQRLAVVIDARSGPLLAEIREALEAVEAMGVKPSIVFLDASDAVLVQRFKETRRPHPYFSEKGGILDGIEAERLLLREVKELAEKIVDTSGMNTQGLRNALHAAYFADSPESRRLTVTVESFGFKYGLPLDADLVFDVRFLKNPHYIDTLRPFDGRDKVIVNYVMGDPASAPFLEKLNDIVSFTLPKYIDEGKAYLTIAIGCTGGQHRSVVVAENLADNIRRQDYHVLVQHRDLAKP